MTDDFYFQQIETAWLMHTTCGLILSSVDRGYIDAWHEAGIPLTAVLLGTERTFEQFRPKFPGDRPRSIAYCAPETYKAWRDLET